MRYLGHMCTLVNHIKDQKVVLEGHMFMKINNTNWEAWMFMNLTILIQVLIAR
jgi:hypothetical protein